MLDTEQNSSMMLIPPMDGLDGMHVGCTIGMSVDLGNATHRDIHDVSQGYAMWLEEIVGGRGHNWFLILPNLFGIRPDDGSHFYGVARD